MTCWLCDQPIENPPRIIGRWTATNPRVAHTACLRRLGELDLDLRGETPPGTVPTGGPGR